MKKIQFILILLISVGFIACEYDNYDPPAIRISGKLVYNGENFLYDGSSSNSLLKVVQSGFGKEDGGTVLRVDESGNFTQLLFSGEYWLTLQNNVYPFEMPEFTSLGTGLGYDSIYMNITSDIQRDIEVIPYYIISDFTAAVDGSNIVMTAHVAKNPEVTQSTVPKITFARGYLSTSSIVNGSTKCTRSSRVNLSSDEGTITATVPITGTAASYRQAYTYNYRDYAYCRLSIELDGIPTYYLFTNTIKLDGVPLE